MNKNRIHKHTVIYNNSLEPDAAILATVDDREWEKDFDSEILATRHLGDDRHMILSVPHLIYGFQRYDIVKVDNATDIIKNLEHRSRNTSVRLIFSEDLTESECKDIIQDLIRLGFVVDPYNKLMISADLDVENSREIIKLKMNILKSENKIIDWEYIVQI